MAESRIIHALDVADIVEAVQIAGEVAPHVGRMKIGLEFIVFVFATLWRGDLTVRQKIVFVRSLVRLAKKIGRDIMFDGKFNDISNTVGSATKALGIINPWGFTVHASTGDAALAAAVKHKRASHPIAVTVLTSIDAEECLSIFGCRPDIQVIQFARKALEAGITHLVCAPAEAKLLRGHEEFESLILICPGIRPAWSEPGDQNPARLMTPYKAIMAGIDYLVIGRPIKDAHEYGFPDRAAACAQINADIEAALAARLESALAERVERGVERL